MKEKELITQLFIMQDYAKDLLFNSVTKEQEENSRSFISRIEDELKELYIQPQIENV